jgi:hypothetical protein
LHGETEEEHVSMGDMQERYGETEEERVSMGDMQERYESNAFQIRVLEYYRGPNPFGVFILGSPIHHSFT